MASPLRGDHISNMGRDHIDDAAFHAVRRNDKFSHPTNGSTSMVFAVTSTVFTGCPANFVRKYSLHRTSNPQLAGLSGTIGTSVQPGSEPTRHRSRGGQLPRRAPTRPHRFERSAVLVDYKRSFFSVPSRHRFDMELYAAFLNRRSQARRSGAAFRSVGKIRPDVPINVFTPSS